MDCDLISRVKTKEVDFLKGSQKSKFNVIHGGALPALNKEKSVRSAKEPNILSGSIGKAYAKNRGEKTEENLLSIT
jgi:hypothetical protein